MVIKDYTDFVTQFSKYSKIGIDQQLFNLFFDLGANTWLMFTTKTENIANICKNWIRLYTLYLKNNDFYKLTTDELANIKSTMTGKEYIFNGDDENESANLENFISGQVSKEITTNEPKIKYIQMIEQYLKNVQEPVNRFVNELINSISLPFQNKNPYC